MNHVCDGLIIVCLLHTQKLDVSHNFGAAAVFVCMCTCGYAQLLKLAHPRNNQSLAVWNFSLKTLDERVRPGHE